jgi:hypothetical protein
MYSTPGADATRAPLWIISGVTPESDYPDRTLEFFRHRTEAYRQRLGAFFTGWIEY